MLLPIALHCEQIIHQYVGMFFYFTILTLTFPPVCLCVPICVQDTKSASAVAEMQRGLDENNDGKVSFQEYLTLIGYLANSMSDKLHGQTNSGSNADAS